MTHDDTTKTPFQLYTSYYFHGPEISCARAKQYTDKEFLRAHVMLREQV